MSRDRRALIQPTPARECFFGGAEKSRLVDELLALFQCLERGIQPGPLGTFPKWVELGRYVKKGEKALTLCLPVTCKLKKTVTKEDGTEQEEEVAFRHFTYKSQWFVTAQTEGTEYQPPAIPESDEPSRR